MPAKPPPFRAPKPKPGLGVSPRVLKVPVIGVLLLLLALGALLVVTVVL